MNTGRSSASISPLNAVHKITNLDWVIGEVQLCCHINGVVAVITEKGKKGRREREKREER